MFLEQHKVIDEENFSPLVGKKKLLLLFLMWCFVCLFFLFSGERPKKQYYDVCYYVP